MTEQEATERFRATDREVDKVNNEPEDDCLCFICFTNLPNAVFLDCGHGGRSRLTKVFA